jgi:hypothetical protein
MCFWADYVPPSTADGHGRRQDQLVSRRGRARHNPIRSKTDDQGPQILRCRTGFRGVIDRHFRQYASGHCGLLLPLDATRNGLHSVKSSFIKRVNAMSKFVNTAALAVGLVLTMAGSYAHAQGTPGVRTLRIEPRTPVAIPSDTRVGRATMPGYPTPVSGARRTEPDSEGTLRLNTPVSRATRIEQPGPMQIPMPPYYNWPPRR